MKKIDIQITKNVKGIPDVAFYIMKPDANGNIWFIGDGETTHAYKFDGDTATKYSFNRQYGVHDFYSFTASPKGEIYFSAYPIGNLDFEHPTIVCINEDEAYEISCTDFKSNIEPYKIASSSDKLVCALKHMLNSKSNIYLVENNHAIPLVSEMEFYEINDMAFTTAGNLLIVCGDQKGHLIDFDNSKLIRNFRISKNHILSHELGAIIMPDKIILVDFENNFLQVRNDQGKLLHDISTLGKTDHPVSKILAQISDHTPELANVTKIDDETILLVLKERYGNKKNFLRTLHLPTMELLPHKYDGKIKGNITSCTFDKNGSLWLNKRARKDTSKINKITQDKKLVNIQETIFIHS